ncbi:type I-B CRISPR-associated protein Cas5b [Hazenella coriacea]|uniref:CRISPR-associated Cas5t family protein n=1 Tax=Hazenella coriacea TaxID=1179467 RepID=A0A4R3L2C4_9BACL|nr:type I-B CRISPR-associated protein Cas5b [Hazenella coriacea]TCS93599.1 CRISPR-associated Cas5t family protein [Hazenella coriacea]
MKVLKIKLFQETASYTKPFAFKVGETYPIPPYSTVIGMIHWIIGATSYQEMNVSIQGNYEDKFVDYRTTSLFKGNTIATSPLNVHLLYGVSLTIHISADKELLHQIAQELSSPGEYLSLGRKEDLVRIDSISWMDVTEEETSGHHHTLTQGIYIPLDYLYDPELTSGIRYRLNTTYDVLHDQRIWKKIDVLYLTEGDLLEEETLFKDEEGDLVYFFSPYK